jgi:hypothetical protein
MADEKKKRTWGFDVVSIASLAGAVLSLIFFIVLFAFIGGLQTGEIVEESSSEISIDLSSIATSSESGASSLLFLDVTSDPLAVIKTQDNLLNIFFLLPVLLLSLAGFFDTFFRKNVSHILLVLAGGLVLIIYALMKAITLTAANKFAPAIFYYLSLPALAALEFSYVRKALDGDANRLFYVSYALSILFLFFAGVLTYTVFDAYGHAGDHIFWGGFCASRLMLYFLISNTLISLHCDYDPNPIELDEFGNPVHKVAGKPAAK